MIVRLSLVSEFILKKIDSKVICLTVSIALKSLDGGKTGKGIIQHLMLYLVVDVACSSPKKPYNKTQKLHFKDDAEFF